MQLPFAPRSPATASAICYVHPSSGFLLDNMSEKTYFPSSMNVEYRPLVWLHGEVKTPPFSPEARLETGYPLRLLQGGESLSLPWSRPMPSVGMRCHELRVNDSNRTWRIIYRVDSDAIVILEVFAKKTQATPGQVIEICKKRLKQYESVRRGYTYG